MNQQIPNGAVPDMLLPFRVPKDAAVAKIREFVGKRQFFAHPRFKKEFAPENVMGVYLPYMVIDVNAHAAMSGVGEHELRRYTVKVGDNHETRYDVEIYQVSREFDVHVNDLTVESSSGRLDQRVSANTNNIINSIMPFDTANAVRYDANYLSGFTMERRDTNVEHLMPLAQVQAGDIARYQANSTLAYYDRGVRWDNERLDVVGQRWVSAYLPVWLYSYYQRKSDGSSFLHYVAVNARTGETMGSVPINKGKLLAVSAVVQVIGMVLGTIILVVADEPRAPRADHRRVERQLVRRPPDVRAAPVRLRLRVLRPDVPAVPQLRQAPPPRAGDRGPDRRRARMGPARGDEEGRQALEDEGCQQRRGPRLDQPGRCRDRGDAGNRREHDPQPDGLSGCRGGGRPVGSTGEHRPAHSRRRRPRGGGR